MIRVLGVSGNLQLVHAEARRLGEGWAVVIGGVLCASVLWLLVRTQRTFWCYDARATLTTLT